MLEKNQSSIKAAKSIKNSSQSVTKPTIQSLNNGRRMNENSYKILKSKLDKNIREAITSVILDNKQSITFEQLGRVFTLLNVFYIIQYDENFQILNPEQFAHAYTKDKKRRYDEMMFHENFWTVFSENCDSETIDINIVFNALMVLFDPLYLSHTDCVNVLEEYLNKLNLNSHKNECSLLELVKTFKELSALQKKTYDYSKRYPKRK